MLKGERLRELRLQKGYTHQELADLLGVSERQITRYESGKTDPSSSVLTRAAQVLGVTTDYLVGLADDIAPGLKGGEMSLKEQAIIVAIRNGHIIEAINMITSQ